MIVAGRTPAQLLAALMLALLVSAAARAEVVESSATGFLIHNTVVVRGTPAEAYAAFAEHIREWWTPAHTLTGSSANLTLEARAGGCLCETLPNGGSAQHLQVVLAAPGYTIRMLGGLGPLQGHGVAGSLTYAFTARGDSTVIDQAYSVGGYFKGGLNKIAPIADTVLREMLASLESYVNTGKPKW